MNFIIQSLLVLSTLSPLSKNPNNKDIEVLRNKNLEVLFTIYNQIWTPFSDDGISKEMIENTFLMKKNHDFFNRFKNHIAISKSKSFMKRSGTDFFLYAFYYEDFPQVKRKRKIPEILTKDINENYELALMEIDNLMTHISDFYNVSGFEKFNSLNEDVYLKAKNEILANLPKQDFILFLEKYFNKRHASYKFIIMPFFKTEFGMAHQLRKDNLIDNITFISPFLPASIDKQGIVNHVGYDSKKHILEWTVHEYSHLFFNYSLNRKKNLEALDKYSHLYKPIEGQPQIQNWYSMFSEHLAVAFEIRVAALNRNDTNYQNLLNKHEAYIYLDHFIEQLQYFESNKDKYTCIDDFIPVMIKSCKLL
ncbi:DUF4932 domain-containing protein [Winogradskyella maritima]|uniref:DUF4932 domain-containing protein n=1 Tax=Winogradskyella maritima TaxID=1517766 RepID=A0ABV8AI43_9FLAO|nr:DUF4932 domain-containing protein [Winogradskyella maritima]